MRVGRPRTTARGTGSLMHVTITGTELLRPLRTAGMTMSGGTLIVNNKMYNVRATLSLNSVKFGACVMREGPAVNKEVKRLSGAFPALSYSVYVLTPGVMSYTGRRGVRLVSCTRMGRMSKCVKGFAMGMRGGTECISRSLYAKYKTYMRTYPVRVPGCCSRNMNVIGTTCVPFPRTMPLYTAVSGSCYVRYVLYARTYNPSTVSRGRRTARVRLRINAVMTTVNCSPFSPSKVCRCKCKHCAGMVATVRVREVVGTSNPANKRMVGPSSNVRPGHMTFVRYINSESRAVNGPCYSEMYYVCSVGGTRLYVSRRPSARMAYCCVSVHTFNGKCRRFCGASRRGCNVRFVENGPTRVFRGSSLALAVETRSALLNGMARCACSLIMLDMNLRRTTKSSRLERALNISGSTSKFCVRTRPGLEPISALASNICVTNMTRNPGSVPSSMTRNSTTTSETTVPVTRKRMRVRPVVTSGSRTVYNTYRMYMRLYPCNTVNVTANMNKGRFTRVGSTLYGKYNAYMNTYPSNTVGRRRFGARRVVTRVDTTLRSVNG